MLLVSSSRSANSWRCKRWKNTNTWTLTAQRHYVLLQRHSPHQFTVHQLSGAQRRKDVLDPVTHDATSLEALGYTVYLWPHQDVFSYQVPGKWWTIVKCAVWYTDKKPMMLHGRQPALPVHFRGKFLPKKPRVSVRKFRGAPSYCSSASLWPFSSRIVMRIFCDKSTYTVVHRSLCVRPKDQEEEEEEEEKKERESVGRGTDAVLRGTAAARFFRHCTWNVAPQIELMSVDIPVHMECHLTHLWLAYMCPSPGIFQRMSRHVSLVLLHIPAVRTCNFTCSWVRRILCSVDCGMQDSRLCSFHFLWSANKIISESIHISFTGWSINGAFHFTISTILTK